jgi:L-rhamnose mutarotase
MIRSAFTMKLKPGCEAEYERRHNAIWPELEAELRAAGISDYSIFLDRENRTLFAVCKLRPENKSAELPSSPVVRKWWDYMAPLMETHPDNRPVETELKQVFHLE